MLFRSGGTLLYSGIFYQNEYDNFRLAYKERIETLTNKDQIYNRYQTPTLQVIRDSYRDSRDQSYMWLVVVYALQVLDATVEAHFVDFNMNENFIDKALLRSGRVDKIIYINEPIFDERVQLFKMYLDKLINELPLMPIIPDDQMNIVTDEITEKILQMLIESEIKTRERLVPKKTVISQIPNNTINSNNPNDSINSTLSVGSNSSFLRSVLDEKKDISANIYETNISQKLLDYVADDIKSKIIF